MDNFLFFLLYNSEPAGIWQGLKDLIILALEKLYILTGAIGLPSYALAIILFTVILKIVLYPLTAKQMHSTRKMQRLQPKIEELKKKYKNDPQKQQQEMMKLYKESGVNTLGGCLPLLVQMPILIALYRVLAVFHPLHPENYTFFWIPDLSKPDAIIFPILVAVTTFLQQYLSMTNKKDQTQKIMLYIFPIMFAWMSRNFAAGLAIYWVTYSIVGSIQQLFINKKGKKDDAEYAAEEARRKAKEEAESKAKALGTGANEAGTGTQEATLSQEMAKKVPTPGQRRKLRKKK